MIRHERLSLTRRGAPAVAALLLAGCVQGPDYQRPHVATPTAFRGQGAGQAVGGSVADLPWSGVYQDAALRDLITRGLQNNQDLKVAIARIERARALVGVARAQGRPQVDYDVSGGGENVFVPGRNSADTVAVGTLGASLSAAWEFDVWGRIRRSNEAAEANLLAEQDVHKGVQLTLVAEIAGGYFNLIELDREKVIAEETAGIYGHTLALFGKRYEAGRDSRLPVDRAQAVHDAAVAQLEDVKRQITQQENALQVLIGGYPGPIVRGASLLEQQQPQTPVGATSELLQRRPDILAAEQRMVAANAEIGVAIANRFPRIGLSALAGVLDASIDGNWEGFGVWNAALSATGPIFDGGRLASIEKERRAHLQETVAEYRKTVLVAFRETADALAAQDTLARRRAALESQVTSLRRSSDLALTRYDSGRANYFEVLEAQERLLPAENALAQTQRDQLLAVVSLYKALGGGWERTEAAARSEPPRS